MKQKMMIFMLILSLLIPQTALANEDVINYKETEGYARSFFEHITEYQTIVASKFEDNFNATYEHIENVKATAGQYYDSAIKLNEELKNGEKTHIGVFMSLIGGAYFTGKDVVNGVWDYIKGKFSSGEEIENPELEEVFINVGRVNTELYDIALIDEDGTIISSNSGVSQVVFSYNSTGVRYNYSNGAGTTWQAGLARWYVEGTERVPEVDRVLNNTMLYPLEKVIFLNKYTREKIIFIRKSDNGQVPTQIIINNPTITRVVDNVQNNDYLKDYYPKNYEPKMVLQLTCNNQSLNAVYNSANDSYYVGQQLVTFKSDGLVYLDGQPCSAFTWNTPQIQVSEDDDIKDMLITDGTGKTETISDKEYQTPECDGVLCWVSNIWGMVKDLVKSIGGLASTVVNLVTNLIDSLFHLIVPENLDFITDLFDSLKTTFTEKFAITTDIQNLFKSIFTESTTNPLTDLSFTLPATDTELSFSVFAVVDDYVPMIKRIISALLALMTLMYVYRKITGSGGVMEK